MYVVQVQHCEEQVRQKPVFTKDSLHLQKTKREHRQANLKQAEDELARLKQFIRLVDHMALSRLLSLATCNVAKFVGDVMVTKKKSTRDALFKASLVFNSKVEKLL